MEEFSLLLRRWFITAVWMGLMLYASTDIASGAHTGSTLRQFLLEWGLPVTEEMLNTINFLLRKAGHVTEFAILAILLWKDIEPLIRKQWRFFDPRLVASVMTVSIAFAAASEWIQRFYPSREPSIRDVFINTGGAALGVICMGLMRPRRRKSSRSVSRILFTSDLHLDQESNSLDQLRIAIEQTQPDICVVAGDIGVAERAFRWLQELKAATTGTRLVVCLGNHDHWLKRDQHVLYPTMAEIRERIWRPDLEAAGIPCLDFGNVEFDDVVLTGGYGHFDLGMRVPQLKFDDQEATLEDYQRGEFAGLVSNDMCYHPNATSALAWEAEVQAKGIAQRLEAAVKTEKTVVVVTHTVPFPALIAPEAGSTAPKQFLRAYAGNTLVGRALAKYRNQITLAVCGHTHAHVPFKVVNGVPCLNIGSDYQSLGFVLYHLARPARSARCFRV